MDCPHCHEALPGEPCKSCQELLPPSAAFCPACGFPQQEALLTCDTCGRLLLPDANYCSECGLPAVRDSFKEEPPAETDQGGGPGKRRACSDGMCVGIIGANGRCTECGKTPSGEVMPLDADDDAGFAADAALSEADSEESLPDAVEIEADAEAQSADPEPPEADIPEQAAKEEKE